MIKLLSYTSFLPTKSPCITREFKGSKEERFPSIFHGYFYQDGDLDMKINERRKSQRLFDEPRIMVWFIQLLLAVQYMHERCVSFSLRTSFKFHLVLHISDELLSIAFFAFNLTVTNTDLNFSCFLSQILYVFYKFFMYFYKFFMYFYKFFMYFYKFFMYFYKFFMYFYKFFMYFYFANLKNWPQTDWPEQCP